MQSAATVSSFRPAAVLLAVALSLAPHTSAAAPQPSPDEIRKTFLELINAERTRLALKPLTLDAALVTAAQAHADDMTAGSYYDFKSPDGKQIEQWAEAAGYRYQYITEKITNKTGLRA